MDIRPINTGIASAAVASDLSSSAVKPAPLQSFAAAPTVPGALVQQAGGAVSPAQVKQAVKDINEVMKSLSNNLEFSVDEDSEQTIVKVVDGQTGDIIRQIPSKEALEISRALDKVQGLLVRQKA